MPQNPFVALVGKNPSNIPVLLNTDVDGNLKVEVEASVGDVLVGKTPTDTAIALNTDAAGTLAVVNDSSGDPAVPAMDSAGNIKVLVSVHDSSNAAVILTENADGGIPSHITNVPGSDYTTTMNITTATAIKGSAGVVGTVSVVVKGSADGTLNNCATTGAAAASNAVFTLSSSATGATVLNIPFGTGIVVTPGTGQTIAITWK